MNECLVHVCRDKEDYNLSIHAVCYQPFLAVSAWFRLVGCFSREVVPKAATLSINYGSSLLTALHWSGSDSSYVIVVKMVGCPGYKHYKHYKQRGRRVITCRK